METKSIRKSYDYGIRIGWKYNRQTIQNYSIPDIDTSKTKYTFLKIVGINDRIIDNHNYFHQSNDRSNKYYLIKMISIIIFNNLSLK